MRIMIKPEWLFMQTPKEKAYQLAKAFYVEKIGRAHV
jgi:hypothetical protein